MTHWAVYGAVAFALSWTVQHLIIRLSQASGLLIDDADKPQKLHRRSIPRAGGIGLFAGALLLWSFPVGKAAVLCMIPALLSGLIEDFYQKLSPAVRLLMQSAAALAAILYADATVRYLGLGIHLPYWMGVGFSLIAIAGFMNAMNLIDGLNGLAAGIGMLILTSFAVTAWRVGDEAMVAYTLIVGGATAGFLLHNFPRARIFLGDGGAYLLGFLIALPGIYLAGHHEDVSPWYIFAVLIYPVWEVFFSVYRRKRAGRSATEADAAHLHTLLYRRLGSNPGATIRLLLGYAPYLAIATLIAHHSIGCILLSLGFVFVYTILYRRLSA